MAQEAHPEQAQMVSELVRLYAHACVDQGMLSYLGTKLLMLLVPCMEGLFTVDGL